MAFTFAFNIRAAIVAAALIGGSAAQAGAAPGPIAVRSCTILQAVHTPHAWWLPWGPPVPHGAPYADGIRIVYVNTGPAVANRVAFAVNYRGDNQRIVDVGSFSPNATIDHTFGNFSGDAYLGPNPNSCVARAVRFVDGTVWRLVAP